MKPEHSLRIKHLPKNTFTEVLAKICEAPGYMIDDIMEFVLEEDK